MQPSLSPLPHASSPLPFQRLVLPARVAAATLAFLSPNPGLPRRVATTSPRRHPTGRASAKAHVVPTTLPPPWSCCNLQQDDRKPPSSRTIRRCLGRCGYVSSSTQEEHGLPIRPSVARRGRMRSRGLTATTGRSGAVEALVVGDSGKMWLERRSATQQGEHPLGKSRNEASLSHGVAVGEH